MIVKDKSQLHMEKVWRLRWLIRQWKMPSEMTREKLRVMSPRHLGFLNDSVLGDALHAQGYRPLFVANKGEIWTCSALPDAFDPNQYDIL